MSKSETKRSKTADSGLTISVGRTNSLMRKMGYARRLSSTAPIAAAAVLDYITNELLTQSLKCAKSKEKKRINPRHIFLALRDSELKGILSCGIFNNSGVVETHKEFLQNEKKKLEERKKARAEARQEKNKNKPAKKTSKKKTKSQ